MKRITRYTTISLMLALGVLTLASACAPAGASMPEIAIRAHDFSFEAPAQVNAGLVSVTMTNDGHEPHHAQLARLNDGVTADQFAAAMQQDPNAALALIALAGGPGMVNPGRQQTVMADLSAGTYVILCFVESQDGVPHLAKGMVSTFEVVEGGGAAASEPAADVTIDMTDFAFSMPGDFEAGEQVWKVTNQGPQPHEIALLKLADGKTLEDAFAWFQSPQGPPPFEAAGGFQGVVPGQSGWLKVNLTPGNYVALCFIPNLATGLTHAEHGMIRPFTVQ